MVNDPAIEPDSLVEKIKAIIPKSRLALVPGSLDFLRAGDRVSNVAYLGGALLKIKPRIELIDGKLVSTKKYRGNMYAVSEKLLHDFLKQYDIDREQLYFQYSLGLDERIKQRMDDMTKENGFKKSEQVLILLYAIIRLDEHYLVQFNLIKWHEKSDKANYFINR